MVVYSYVYARFPTLMSQRTCWGCLRLVKASVCGYHLARE